MNFKENPSFLTFFQGNAFQFKLLCLRWKIIIFFSIFSLSKKLFNSYHFEPDDFFSEPDQRSPSTLGGKYQEDCFKDDKWSNLVLVTKKANVKWIEFQENKKKKLELTLLKVGISKKEKNQKKMSKNGKKKPNNKRMGQRRLKKMEAKRNPSHGKKWSLVWSPLNTYFGPIYPFFHEPEPWPTLRALKVHFDQIWIFKLKSSFLKKEKKNLYNQ